MKVEWYMAARARIVYNGQETMVGAALDKSDDDPTVVAVEELFHTWLGNSSKLPLDAIETLIAQHVDSGEVLPISNAEAYMAAQWLSQGPLENLPDPIPRAFVLYFAKAWAAAGKYDSMAAALSDILATRTFV